VTRPLRLKAARSNTCVGEPVAEVELHLGGSIACARHSVASPIFQHSRGGAFALCRLNVHERPLVSAAIYAPEVIQTIFLP